MSVLKGIADILDNSGSSILGMGGGSNAGTAPTGFSGALVNRTATLALTTGAFSTIAWNAEVYDNGSWHDNATNNTRLTVPASISKVRLVAAIFSSDSIAGDYVISIFKNGSALNVLGQQHCDTATDDGVSIASPVIDVIEGDYFEVVYIVGTNRTLDISGSYFGIEAVSSPSLIPVAADFPTSKGNATGIAITDLVGGVRLVKDAGATRARGAKVKSVSGNFKVTARITHVQATNNDFRFAGIVIIDTTTDEHYMILLNMIGVTTSSTGVGVSHSSSYTAVEVSDGSKNIIGLHTAYLQVEDDGTNLIFAWSPDGIVFQELLSIGRTVNLTNGPGFLGLVGYSVSTTADVIELLCSHWDQT